MLYAQSYRMDWRVALLQHDAQSYRMDWRVALLQQITLDFICKMHIIVCIMHTIKNIW